MRNSSFKRDLEKERRLSLYLDGLYSKHLRHYQFSRETNLEEQLKGVDVVLTHRQTKKRYFVDEKAQLDYLNEDLPTFAFELSYQKDGKRKTGWLFDTNKKTQFYALVTGIYSDRPAVFTSAKITLVNRKLLLNTLKEKDICEENIVLPSTHGQKILPQLDHKKEGYLFHSKNNKAEEPLNLILRLDFLLRTGVAKKLV